MDGGGWEEAQSLGSKINELIMERGDLREKLAAAEAEIARLTHCYNDLHSYMEERNALLGRAIEGLSHLAKQQTQKEYEETEDEACDVDTLAEAYDFMVREARKALEAIQAARKGEA